MINDKKDLSLECNGIMAISKYQSARKCRICDTMFQNRAYNSTKMWHILVKTELLSVPYATDLTAIEMN